MVLEVDKSFMLKDIKLSDIENIALNAGKAILEIYKQDFQIEYKDDNSPLTEADRVSNNIICNSLEKLYPHIPILSEEREIISFEERSNWDIFWLIDPLDGTKEFIKKNGQFTVNIALIINGVPRLGVVYAPVINKLYSAKYNEGAFLNGFKLPITQNNPNLKVVASRSHLSKETDSFINQLKVEYPNLTVESQGSSLKLCIVAEGKADIYPRLAPTMEWDIASGHAILLEVGKGVYFYDENINPLDYLKNRGNLKSLKYNKRNLKNPYFIAV